ncbi:signal peptidase II [bacterium]|nr:signal peptidase II [bacterium]
MEKTKDNFLKFKKDFGIAVKDKKRWLFCGIELLIIGLLIVFDMLTKKYIYGHCDTVNDIVIIDGVIRFTAVKNTGAGFGILKNQTGALTAISFFSSILLIIFIFYSYPRRNKILRSALVMIIAGAIGNLIDRMVLGYVRDFVYFELIDFAIFNFADSFLTIGTALLIIYILFFYSKEENELMEKKKAAKAQADIEEKAQEAVKAKEQEDSEKK